MSLRALRQAQYKLREAISSLIEESWLGKFLCLIGDCVAMAPRRRFVAHLPWRAVPGTNAPRNDI